MGLVSGIEAEVLELPAPCRVRVAETLEVDAARKARFDSRLDKLGARNASESEFLGLPVFSCSPRGVDDNSAPGSASFMRS